jgi:hypothetical protein
VAAVLNCSGCQHAAAHLFPQVHQARRIRPLEGWKQGVIPAWQDRLVSLGGGTVAWVISALNRSG